MCERKTRKFVCNRCSDYIFVEDPQETTCEFKEDDKPCGHLDQLDIVKCEPALCTRCSSFPSDSPLPFIGPPDLAPMDGCDPMFRCGALFLIPAIAHRQRRDAVMKATGVQQPLGLKGCAPNEVRIAKIDELVSRLKKELAKRETESKATAEESFVSTE
ncbi:hypothetical protein NW768_010364 [Fusarium equiseti]|uniref:Uncharacterized protein n=1 Tax=Fusarium equiseti TaxID=61235 RepID=A0ABQ8R0G3_FUSEQ|nr:hypothetical protein NW768_010364 [Fusarium equiseti]